MRDTRYLPLVCWSMALVLTICYSVGRPEGIRAASPNIVIVLADDMGYSDLGCYGSEIETPHLDALAANGLRFTQFYNTGRCWPTRAALMTGYYPHQIRRDDLPGDPPVKRGNRPTWAPLIATELAERGYRCYHAGKWHIDGRVLDNGFLHSYRTNDHNRFFSPRNHLLDDEELPAVPRDTGYYATTAIADRVIAQLRDHARDYRDEPFFSYIAFIAPHFPLHALQEDIARCAGRYDEGWDVIRQRRWKRIRDMKIIPGELSPPERSVGPPYDFPDAIEALGAGEVNRPYAWDSLGDEQRSFQSAKMEIHAAMIERIDFELGRIVTQIKAMHCWDDTLIFFLSDNGASAEIMVRGDGHDPTAVPGSADTYLCLGPGWSTCSNTPFRRHKTWVHEGGIATPLVAHWPRGIAGTGRWCHEAAHVVDMVPTMLELTSAEPADTDRAGGQTSPGQHAPVRPGVSLTPAFRSEPVGDHDLWWLHEGNRAIRAGKWKLVAAANQGDQNWELYDMGVDRSETHDLAAKYPLVVERLAARWNELAEQFRLDAFRDASN